MCDFLYKYKHEYVHKYNNNTEISWSVQYICNLKSIFLLRNEADVKCVKPDIVTPCKILEGSCLFDLEADPCEYNNLAKRYVTPE